MIVCHYTTHLIKLVSETANTDISTGQDADVWIPHVSILEKYIKYK